MDILKIIFSVLFVVSCVLFVFFIIKTFYYYYDDSIYKAGNYIILSFLCLIMIYVSTSMVNSINYYQIIESNNISVINNSFYKDGYCYFELEGTDNYVKIPADEVQIYD